MSGPAHALHSPATTVAGTNGSARDDPLVWYHTIDLPDGPTPGIYDLRAVAHQLPWPDLRGKRCLDVGTRNGFFAFEMERRGAAEVVALDIDDPADIDFAAYRPEHGFDHEDLDNGVRAFDVAARALHSNVQRHALSVYRLTPDAIGQFDFAVIGTLLLHLRDPVGALAAIRRVLNGPLLVNEAVTPSLDVLRRRPVAELLMYPGLPFWWLVNPSGLRTMVEAGGFAIERAGRPYLLPDGPGAPPRRVRDCLQPRRDLARNLLRLKGDPHCWLLARPAGRP